MTLEIRSYIHNQINIKRVLVNALSFLLKAWFLSCFTSLWIFWQWKDVTRVVNTGKVTSAIPEATFSPGIIPSSLRCLSVLHCPRLTYSSILLWIWYKTYRKYFFSGWKFFHKRFLNSRETDGHLSMSQFIPSRCSPSSTTTFADRTVKIEWLARFLGRATIMKLKFDPLSLCCTVRRTSRWRLIWTIIGRCMTFIIKWIQKRSL